MTKAHIEAIPAAMIKHVRMAVAKTAIEAAILIKAIITKVVMVTAPITFMLARTVAIMMEATVTVTVAIKGRCLGMIATTAAGAIFSIVTMNGAMTAVAGNQIMGQSSSLPHNLASGCV